MKFEFTGLNQTITKITPSNFWEVQKLNLEEKAMTDLMLPHISLGMAETVITIKELLRKNHSRQTARE